jgi:hypothetical protein
MDGRIVVINAIIAGTHWQAQRFALDNGWSPKEFVYVDRREQLLGMQNFTVWRVGTFRDRKDIREIEQAVAQSRGVMEGV